MARLLSAIAALAASSLLVTGPVLDWLEDMAWGLDKPGYWSVEQSFTISMVLLALLYVLFAVLVARWSGLLGWRIAAAVAMSLPFTLGFMRLLSWFLYQLVVANVLDAALAAHSPVWSAYLPQLASAAFHVGGVVIVSNLLHSAVATRLTSASS